MTGRRTIGSLLVRLGFDPKEVDQGLKKFERNLKQTARNMESIGRTMSIGFTAPFILGIRQAIKAYDEEAQVVKKLEVALGRTSQALLNQAAAIQKTTVYADDQVIAVQAWAAALGHSESEVRKMTDAAVGLAAGLGIGLDQAMEMLHKSTMGASRGLGQLVPGVKDLTKEQLKAGAAVDLVNEKFKGFAEQAAKTGLGPLKQLQNQLGDMMEDVGKIAIPFVTKLAEKLKAIAEWFDDLSPKTKEMVIQFGAFVALTGPLMVMTSQVFKLVGAVNALAVALKGMAFAGKGAVGAIAAIGTAEVMAGGSGMEGAAKFGVDLATWYGRQYGSPGNSSYANQNLGLIPGMPAAQNTGFLAPPSRVAGGGGGTGGGMGGPRGIQWMSQMLGLQPRGNGIGSIAPNLNPMAAGGFGNGGLTPLAGVGGHGEAIAGMMGIMPDLTSVLEGQQKSVEHLTNGYLQLGDAMGSVMSDVAESLLNGGNAFEAFGKAALKAAAQVVKAMLAASLARAVEKGAATAGVPGIIIGATLGLAAIGLVEGMIGKMKTPKLAEGGVTMGATMALIGDNRSGKELVMPFEKSGEFAQAIANRLGGGGQTVMGVIRGNDIHLVTAKAQGRQQRIGSGNVIQF